MKIATMEFVSFPVVTYKISVHTGEKWGSGTDADVFINISGDTGDTGDRPLAKSLNNKNKFENGNVSVFLYHLIVVLNFSISWFLVHGSSITFENEITFWKKKLTQLFMGQHIEAKIKWLSFRRQQF